MDAARIIRLTGLCAIVALGIQVFRPSRTNPVADPAQAIAAHVVIPPAVQAIVHRACYDCHSNETRWPWYSGVAPVSWFVIGHVNDGRRALNFDDWSVHRPGRAQPPLGDICTQVERGAMPLWTYLLMHQDARLKADDVSALCGWAKQVGQVETPK